MQGTKHVKENGIMMRIEVIPHVCRTIFLQLLELNLKHEGLCEEVSVLLSEPLYTWVDLLFLRRFIDLLPS